MPLLGVIGVISGVMLFSYVRTFTNMMKDIATTEVINNPMC